MMKIAIAMSGGIDSSVAAALLKQAGHEVVGLTMQTYDGMSDAENDAAAIARQLGIPHQVIDLRDAFSQQVISYFGDEYQKGRTPNPCVRCNRYIKFGTLREKARDGGAASFATGHYARIEKDHDGRYLLKKGRDGQKDQSYFLSQLTQEQLYDTIFPIGHLRKTEVRKIAAELGLKAAARPESREICFIPDNDHTRFLRENLGLPETPGPITDDGGKRLGQHRGITSYTIGQRKGLKIASTEPLFVTDIIAEDNTITVGNKESTYATELIADNLNWIAIPAPDGPIKVNARIRYRHREAEAIVTPLDSNTVYVKFALPQPAITPGQVVVFYDGDCVLGGGTIIKRGK
jgi:tRNA-specific 2-thiouridylase